MFKFCILFSDHAEKDQAKVTPGFELFEIPLRSWCGLPSLTKIGSGARSSFGAIGLSPIPATGHSPNTLYIKER
jgi:hypothetical protein